MSRCGGMTPTETRRALEARRWHEAAERWRRLVFAALVEHPNRLGGGVLGVLQIRVDTDAIEGALSAPAESTQGYRLDTTGCRPTGSSPSSARLKPQAEREGVGRADGRKSFGW